MKNNLLDIMVNAVLNIVFIIFLVIWLIIAGMFTIKLYQNLFEEDYSNMPIIESIK